MVTFYAGDRIVKIAPRLTFTPEYLFVIDRFTPQPDRDTRLQAVTSDHSTPTGTEPSHYLKQVSTAYGRYSF